MSDELKEMVKTVLLLIVRWVLNVGAGVLATLGITSGAAEEVLIGVLMFVVGLVISLIQRKNDLGSDPNA